MRPCLALCDLSEGLIQSVYVIEILVWHVEVAEVYILFVPRLDFRPHNFTICSWMWLSISVRPSLLAVNTPPPGPADLSFG